METRTRSPKSALTHLSAHDQLKHINNAGPFKPRRPAGSSRFENTAHFFCRICYVAPTVSRTDHFGRVLIWRRCSVFGLPWTCVKKSWQDKWGNRFLCARMARIFPLICPPQLHETSTVAGRSEPELRGWLQARSDILRQQN